MNFVKRIEITHTSHDADRIAIKYVTVRIEKRLKVNNFDARWLFKLNESLFEIPKDANRCLQSLLFQVLNNESALEIQCTFQLTGCQCVGRTLKSPAACTSVITRWKIGALLLLIRNVNVKTQKNYYDNVKEH